MPPPFRQSCTNCVKSKRRCDLVLPRCYRCRVRSLNCSYQNASSFISARQQSTSSQPGSVTEQDPSSTHQKEPLSVDASTEMASSIEPNFDSNQLETQLAPFPDYDLDWPDTMGNIESYWVPDQIGPNNLQTRSVLAGEIYQGRIIYSVKRIKTYPNLLVTQGSTPFIHKKLYLDYMPQAIQDILGICALYGQKTEQNQSLVFKTIGLKAAQLLAGHTSQGSSAIEQLASLQALVLFQIIRLFDGDIRLRADAERTDAILNEWTQQLKPRLQRVNSTSENERTIASVSGDTTWESWIFHESLRRTILVSFSVQGLYSFLKNGWDDSHHEINLLSFYAQTALWDATSEYYWRSALEEHNALLVRFSCWDTDMKSAKPLDMEDLGITMMALIKGVEETCDWVGNQNLEKFGLALHQTE